MIKHPDLITTVVWDMGGVLLRTEDPIPRTRLAEKFGLTSLELEAIVFNSETSRMAEAGKIEELEHHRYVLEKLGLPSDQWESFIEEFFAGDRLNDELVFQMRLLSPSYRLGLLSNAWQSARSFISTRYAVLDVFQSIIFSAEVGMRKPDQRIYKLALEKLGAAPGEAIFVDDVLENIEAAHSVGMQAVQYVSNRQVLQELSAL